MGNITIRVTREGSPAVGVEIITVHPYGPYTTDAQGEISINVPDGFGPHLMPVDISGPGFTFGPGNVRLEDGDVKVYDL